MKLSPSISSGERPRVTVKDPDGKIYLSKPDSSSTPAALAAFCRVCCNWKHHRTFPCAGRFSRILKTVSRQADFDRNKILHYGSSGP